MKRLLTVLLALLLASLTQLPCHAQEAGGPDGMDFDFDAQLDALGRDELLGGLPDETRALLEEAGADLSVESLLGLSPRDFFRTIWQLFLAQLQKPVRVLCTVTGILILCSLLGGLKTAAGDNTLAQVFNTVSALCILASVAAPILDCIVTTERVIRDASAFMLSFIPVFATALVAAGQPATGAAYNLFLFGACQVVSQALAGTLVPLMSIYLALCIVGSLVPDMNIRSATASIKTLVTWSLGFMVTLFVGLLSVQTMVSHGADSLTTKTAKFVLGSFVPVVGSVLSEALLAAQGCLRLLKTTVGAFGILAAALTFLPVLLQTVAWRLISSLLAATGDVLGVKGVPDILRACSTVLSILLSIILCYALLIIVSTAVILVTGLGTA